MGVLFWKYLTLSWNNPILFTPDSYRDYDLRFTPDSYRDYNLHGYYHLFDIIFCSAVRNMRLLSNLSDRINRINMFKNFIDNTSFKSFKSCLWCYFHRAKFFIIRDYKLKSPYFKMLIWNMDLCNLLWRQDLFLQREGFPVSSLFSVRFPLNSPFSF